jgi:hypothetical protein
LLKEPLELPSYLFGLLAVGERTPQELGLHPIQSWEISVICQNVTDKEAITQLSDLTGWVIRKLRAHTFMNERKR